MPSSAPRFIPRTPSAPRSTRLLLGALVWTPVWALSSIPARALDHFSVRDEILPDLARPTDVLVFESGALWIAEPDAAWVRIVEPGSSEPPRILGMKGADVELVRPVGLCRLDANRIAVSDQGADRIQLFDPEGKHLGTIGSTGSGPGCLRAPAGITADETTLYVADRGNRRITRFKHDGTALESVGAGHGWIDPIDVALDRRGHLFVLDTDSASIHKLDGSGTPILSFGGFGKHPGGLRVPGGLRFHGGKLYVADRGNHRIQEFDTSGNLLGLWGRPSLRAGQDDGGLFAPTAIDLSQDGSRIWVCEPWEGRLQSFVRGDETSTHDHGGHTGAERGALLGEFLAGDPRSELLLVHDRERDEVLVYDTRHDAPVRIATLGGHGTGLGEFRAPSGGAIDAGRGLIWIADGGNRRIQGFRLRRDPDDPLAYEPLGPMVVKSIDLEFLRRQAGTEELPFTVRPGAVACDAEGGLYVADTHNGVVFALSPEFDLEGVLRGPDRLDSGVPMEPSSILVDERGARVWVLDGLGHRVVSYDRTGRIERVLDAGPWTSSPASIALDGEGALLVLGRRGSLTRWAPTARTDPPGFERVRSPIDLDGIRGPQTLRRPTAIVGHPRGLLYVVDPALRQGQLLDGRGNFRLAF